MLQKLQIRPITHDYVFFASCAKDLTKGEPICLIIYMIELENCWIDFENSNADFMPLNATQR
jgi:hypothetical protein